MRKLLTICAICAICGLLFGFTGCEKRDAYQRAALAAADFATSLKTFQQAEIAVYHSGAIDKEEHIAIQRIFLETAKAGLQLDQAIRVARSSPDAWAAANAALDSIDKLQAEGVLHIKSDKARAQLAASLALARSAIIAVRLALPAPAITPGPGGAL